MSHGYSTLGFVVIVILYAVIGFWLRRAPLHARKVLAPKAEQIATRSPHHDRRVHLAFTAYFESRWRGGWKRLPPWRLLARFAGRACPSP
jgi:hypothetical protein